MSIRSWIHELSAPIVPSIYLWSMKPEFEEYGPLTTQERHAALASYERWSTARYTKPDGTWNKRLYKRDMKVQRVERAAQLQALKDGASGTADRSDYKARTEKLMALGLSDEAMAFIKSYWPEEGRQ